jgi:hypothetical protein
MTPSPAHSRAELARLLLLMAAGMTLLAMFGEIILMGSLIYAAVPVIKAALLMLLARKVAALRRWAMVATIVLSGMTLGGFTISTLIGLLPQLDHTVTMTGLVTEVALPLVLIVLSAQLLATNPRRLKVQVAQ